MKNSNFDYFFNFFCDPDGVNFMIFLENFHFEIAKIKGKRRKLIMCNSKDVDGNILNFWVNFDFGVENGAGGAKKVMKIYYGRFVLTRKYSKVLE